jgi:hypothetical protein
MAALKALDPAPFVEVPADAPEVKLMAVEAARSPQGVTATIHAGNGVVQVARLVKLVQEADRECFAREVADATMVAPCFIGEGLLDLMAGVEGALRQTEAQSQNQVQRRSQATALVMLAADAELFHDPAGDAFATIERDYGASRGMAAVDESHSAVVSPTLLRGKRQSSRDSSPPRRPDGPGRQGAVRWSRISCVHQARGA